VGISISKISGFPIWESWEKHHLGLVPMVNHKEYYKGEGGGFPPSAGHVESCESMYVCGSSMHLKCSNYALTNLLFGLCKLI